MRVLHVIPSLGPLRGGPSLVLPTLARALAADGVCLDIATTDDNGPGRLTVPLHEPLHRDGYSIRYFPRQTGFYTFSWPLTRWLSSHVRDYDVVHIHALFSYPSVAAALTARRFHVPYIVRPLGTLNRWGVQHRRPFLKRFSLRLLERPILLNAATVHFTTEEEQLEAQLLGIPIHAEVIALGVDLRPFEELPSPDRFLDHYPDLKGRRIVLFLSRLDPKKGLDLLLPAFAAIRMNHPDAVLVLAGQGEAAYVQSLRQEAARLGIVDSIAWPGFLSGDQKLAALAAADVFVLPSYSENFGITAVEAMAAGLATVMTNSVGVSAAALEACAAVVVPCEVAPLSEALSCLLADAALRGSLGRRAQYLARERFSAQTSAQALTALYRRTVSQHQERWG